MRRRGSASKRDQCGRCRHRRESRRRSQTHPCPPRQTRMGHPPIQKMCRPYGAKRFGE
jgi:hypothetical protein